MRNSDLYHFNADVMDSIAERFFTINHDVPRDRFRPVRGDDAFNAIKEAL